MNQDRRSNYFIKKAFQTYFSLRFFALIVLAAALVAGLFLIVSSGTFTTGYQGTQLMVEKTAAFFSPMLIAISAAVALGVGLIGMIVFIFLSHRIAGPLYRVEKGMREIGKGDLTHRVRLRKTDQLEELAQSLNSFAQQMDEKLGGLQKELEQASAACSDKDKPEEIAKLAEAIRRLKEFTNSFKTTP